MSHLLLLPSRLRLSLLCAGAAFAASSVTAVSHAAPPPTPTVTLANPTPVPTGIAAGKALGVAPVRAVGTSTVLSGLLRYADGTISAKTGTPFERTLAARLDRVPNAKFHAVNAVSPFRVAPPAERQRILPGVTATTIGAGPLNRIDVRKAASQNVAVPNFGQFEVVSGPFIPAPDAPPITYHLDFAGVRCNTPPQNGIAPLVVINEIETTGTSYVTTTQVVPASGTGTSMAAGAISTNGVGPLFDAPSRSLTTLGSGNGGVLLVTAVLQPTSAADAQAQRDRLNLLLATAEVYAAGLSGGSTLVNMQTAVTFTMGVIALSGVGYPSNAVQSKLFTAGDYAQVYTAEPSIAGSVQYKWPIAHAMGANGDYTILVNAPTYRAPVKFAWDLIISMKRPNVTTVPVYDSWNTWTKVETTIGGDWTGYANADMPYTDPPSTTPMRNTAPTIVFRRRSYNRASSHVKIVLVAHGSGTATPPRILTQYQSPSKRGTWCGWDASGLVFNPDYAYFDWVGGCPDLPGGLPDPAQVDVASKTTGTAIEFDVTSDGHISGDVTGGLEQDFTQCGLTAPTACVTFRVQSKP